MLLRTGVTAIAGAVIGGVVVWVGQVGSFRLTSASMSYPDLAAILLTAVGVIVAIFGGVLAIAAVWGFTQLKRDAVNAAEQAAVNELREQIENGSLKDYVRKEAVGAAETAGSTEIKAQIERGPIRELIRDEIARLAKEEFESERMDERINRRVDAVAFGRPADDRLLDEDENGE